MKTTRFPWVLTVLLLAAAMLPAAATAANTTPTATGNIVSLSPATRTVTIQQSDSTEVMLRAGERTASTPIGKAVGFAAVALRDEVSVQLQRSTLVRLDANGPALDSARGVFTGFDAASNLLTMA